MTARIPLKTRYLHLLWAGIVLVLLLLLLAILECQMATPAY